MSISKHAFVAILLTILLVVPAAAAADEHYSIVTVRLYPTRTDTVVDEVWRDASRWRLERRSDHWDNGLVAVGDGMRVLLSLPRVEKALDVQMNSIRAWVDPAVMSVLLKLRRQSTAKEVSVMGRTAFLYSGAIGGSEVRLWVDKQTQLPLREERLDKQGRPTMVVVRNDLPPAQDDPRRFSLSSEVSTRSIDEWKTTAINAWVSEQLRTPIRLAAALPASVQFESAELLSGGEDRGLVIRLARGADLISLFLTPATGEPPTQRRSLDRGLPVQARRIGKYDVILVGRLSAAEAEKLLNALEEQLTPASRD